MKLSVRVREVESRDDSPVVAFASVAVEGMFVIEGIALITRKDDESGLGYGLSFPSRKKGDRRYDYVYPMTREVREEVLRAVLQAYIDQGVK